MKKVIFLSLALVVLMFTQCRKEAKVVEPILKNKVDITFSSNSGSRLSITEAGQVSWSNGDKIHIYSKIDGYLGFITTTDGTSFTGSVTEWADGSDLYFYYLGDNTPTAGIDLKINFFDQSYSGTQNATNDLANIASNFFVSRHVFPSVGALVREFNGQMLNMVALGIFDTSAFTDATTSNVKIYAASNLKNQITISSTGEITYGVAGINPTTDNQSGHIIIGPASGKRYVALLPTAVDAITSVDLMFTSNGMATSSALSEEIKANGFICGENASAIVVNGVSAVSEANYVDMAVASEHVFTVAYNKTVKFAKGNLVYDQGRFKMHKEQYGIVGLTSATVSDNTKVSGTFDYFGWGTSGWDNGNLLYQPYTYSSATSGIYASSKGYGYGPSNNNYKQSLSGDTYKQADWGVYQFGMNTDSEWRALTETEQKYLLSSRPGAADKVGYATVAEVTGLIILSDDFVDPNKNGGSSAFVSKATTGYTQNIYTAEDWETYMEPAGALFLPAIGYRNGTTITVTYYAGGNRGSYWTSTVNGTDNAKRLYYVTNSISNSDNYDKKYAMAVRLVKDVE